jgi:tetratricopeptide (TPR) repeat protein
VRFVVDQPMHALSLLGAKGGALLSDHRPHDLVSAYRFDRKLDEHWVPAVPFSVLAAFALYGAAISLRHWRRLLLLYAFVGTQIGVMLVFYVSERQRLALLPVLVFFAAAGLAHLLAMPGRRLPVPALSCAALVVLFMRPSHFEREDRHLFEQYRVHDEVGPAAFRLRDEGRLAEAARSAALSYAAAPWAGDYARPALVDFGTAGLPTSALATLPRDDGSPSRQLDRAQLLLAAGRWDEAEALLRALLARGSRFHRGFLGSSEPRYYLARVAALRGRKDEAVALLREAASRAPGDPFVLAHLAALTGDDSFRRQIARYFSEIDASFLIGLAQLETDAPGSGLVALAETVERLPEFWRASPYLVAALAAEGDLDGAAELFLRISTARKDPVLLEERIVPIFQTLSAAAPGDWEARQRYGLVLARYGRLKEAAAVLREARRLHPGPQLDSLVSDVDRMLVLSGG